MFNLLDTLFGCPHQHLTFPLTRKRVRLPGARTPDPYVVCLDCGEEFTYDWQKMKVVFSPKRVRTSITAPGVAHKQAA
jgi:hypothetical protein